MKYFSAASNREELKASWKELCKIHHPDKGGAMLTMQLINAEYEAALKSGKFGTASEVEDDLSSYYHIYQAQIELYQAQIDSYMEEMRSSMEYLQEIELPPIAEIEMPNFPDIVIQDISPPPDFGTFEFDFSGIDFGSTSNNHFKPRRQGKTCIAKLRDILASFRKKNLD